MFDLSQLFLYSNLFVVAIVTLLILDIFRLHTIQNISMNIYMVFFALFLTISVFFTKQMDFGKIFIILSLLFFAVVFLTFSLSYYVIINSKYYIYKDNRLILFLKTLFSILVCFVLFLNLYKSDEDFLKKEKDKIILKQQMEKTDLHKLDKSVLFADFTNIILYFPLVIFFLKKMEDKKIYEE